MQQKLRLALVCGFATAFSVLGVSDVAQSATATGQLNVTLTLQSECRVASTSDVAFGTAGVITTPLTATGAVVVQCTSATPFDIGLDAGQGSGATTTNRLMTSGANTITYQLFRDSGHAQNWGDQVGNDTQSGVGTGSAQSFTVYGVVPVQTMPAAGAYSDIVQVTVTY